MGFDEYALTYDQQLQQGLRLAGDGPEWFARRRIQIVREHLDRLDWPIRQALEFGCGVGNHVPFIRQAFPGVQIIGVDASRQSLELADAHHGGGDVRFCVPDEFGEPDSVDLVYVNGVFHHIPPSEHSTWLQYFRRVLRPGGVLAIFDNNPLSLPARMVMRRIPFDHDAVMVSPRSFRRLLSAAGFSKIALEYHFIFPHVLAPLRVIEPSLTKLPLGAQFCLLARLPLA